MKSWPLLLSVTFFIGCARYSHRTEEPFVPSYSNGPFALRRKLIEQKTIKVGSYPKSVSVSPDQKRAYVCNLEGGSVDTLDAKTFSPLIHLDFRRTQIPIEDGKEHPESFQEKPVEIGFTQGGRFVWISLLRAGGVVVYDTQERPVSKNVPHKIVNRKSYLTGKSKPLTLRFIKTGDQPKIVAVTPDEKFVFVANWKGKDVAVIDAQKFKTIKRIKTGYLPRGICFTATSAYVANFGSHTISEIDLKTLQKKRDFQTVGANPRHLVLAADGKTLFISNHGDDHVRRLDLVTGKITGKCKVGNEPRTLCASRLKNVLFVTNYKDDTIAIIDATSFSVSTTISTVRRPIGASFDPKTDTLWVTGYWDQVTRVYKFKTAVERQEIDTAWTSRETNLVKQGP